MNLADAKSFVPRRRVFAPLELGELESFVLSKVDGRRTIEDLSILVGLTPREIVHVMLRFEEMRIVDISPSSGELDLSGASLSE